MAEIISEFDEKSDCSIEDEASGGLCVVQSEEEDTGTGTWSDLEDDEDDFSFFSEFCSREYKNEEELLSILFELFNVENFGGLKQLIIAEESECYEDFLNYFAKKDVMKLVITLGFLDQEKMKFSSPSEKTDFISIISQILTILIEDEEDENGKDSNKILKTLMDHEILELLFSVKVKTEFSIEKFENEIFINTFNSQFFRIIDFLLDHKWEHIVAFLIKKKMIGSFILNENNLKVYNFYRLILKIANIPLSPSNEPQTIGRNGFGGAGMMNFCFHEEKAKPEIKEKIIIELEDSRKMEINIENVQLFLVENCKLIENALQLLTKKENLNDHLFLENLVNSFHQIIGEEIFSDKKNQKNALFSQLCSPKIIDSFLSLMLKNIDSMVFDSILTYFTMIFEDLGKQTKEKDDIFIHSDGIILYSSILESKLFDSLVLLLKYPCALKIWKQENSSLSSSQTLKKQEIEKIIASTEQEREDNALPKKETKKDSDDMFDFFKDPKYLGNKKLKILNFFKSISSVTGHSKSNGKIDVMKYLFKKDLNLLESIIALFFKFPKNNIMHNLIFKFLRTIFKSPLSFGYVVTMINQPQFLTNLMKVTKTKSCCCRGHCVKLGNYILQRLKNEKKEKKEELKSIFTAEVEEIFQSKEWDEFNVLISKENAKNSFIFGEDNVSIDETSQELIITKKTKKPKEIVLEESIQYIKDINGYEVTHIKDEETGEMIELFSSGTVIEYQLYD